MPDPKPLYDCSRCPAYCCSYEHIPVTDRDLDRLAKHFSIEREEAEKKFTKMTKESGRVLRHKEDHIFKSVCRFFDTESRRCTVYEVRPGVCRAYPEGRRCGYWEFLSWERKWQGDEEFVPLMR